MTKRKNGQGKKPRPSAARSRSSAAGSRGAVGGDPPVRPPGGAPQQLPSAVSQGDPAGRVPEVFLRPRAQSRPSRSRALPGSQVPSRQAALRRSEPAIASPERKATPVAAPEAALAFTALRSRSPRLARGAGQKSVEILRSPFGALHEAGPQSLGITYWFEAAPKGEPYPVSVSLSGKLRGDAPPGHQDSFRVNKTVGRVLPGSGRVAMTVRVPDLAAGTWDVTATPIEPSRPGSSTQWSAGSSRRSPAAGSGTTTFTSFANQLAPGVWPGAWPALVATGAVIALLVQLFLAARLGLSVSTLLPLSALACLLGLGGAKMYYVATHRSETVNLVVGMSVQGFVVVAVGTLLVGARLGGLSLGSVLDVTAPGILAGMAVGRVGCLLGGCCVGRPTASRWGVWSSDRHLGLRRIPVQAIESGFAATLALLAVSANLTWGTAPGGLVFLVTMGAYTAGRQLLFPLRQIARTTSHGRIVTLTISCAVSFAGILVAILR